MAIWKGDAQRGTWGIPGRGQRREGFMAQVPIHPAIVHFPIALAVVGALAELVHLVVRKPWIRWMGPILLTIALMGAVGAYFTGQAAEDAVEEQGVPDDAVDAHEQAGI